METKIYYTCVFMLQISCTLALHQYVRESSFEIKNSNSEEVLEFNKLDNFKNNDEFKTLKEQVKYSLKSGAPFNQNQNNIESNDYIEDNFKWDLVNKVTNGDKKSAFKLKKLVHYDDSDYMNDENIDYANGSGDDGDEHVTEEQVDDIDEQQPDDIDEQQPDDAQKPNNEGPVSIDEGECTTRNYTKVINSYFPGYYYDSSSHDCIPSLFDDQSSNHYTSKLDCFLSCNKTGSHLRGIAEMKVDPPPESYLRLNTNKTNNADMLSFDGEGYLYKDNLGQFDYSNVIVYISFKIRTLEQDGLVAFLKINDEYNNNVPSIQIYIFLKNGMMKFRHVYENKSETFDLNKEDDLGYEFWNTIVIRINTKSGDFMFSIGDSEVRKEKIKYLGAKDEFSHDLFHKSKQTIWIGGTKEEHRDTHLSLAERKPFMGCLKDVVLGSGDTNILDFVSPFKADKYEGVAASSQCTNKCLLCTRSIYNNEQHTDSLIFTMHGTNGIKYISPESEKSPVRVQMKFKTKIANSRLITINNNTDSELILELSETGHLKINTKTVLLNSLADDKWHHLVIDKNGPTVNIYMDDENFGTKVMKQPGKLIIFIGFGSRLKGTRPFVGCLTNVWYNSYDLLSKLSQDDKTVQYYSLTNSPAPSFSSQCQDQSDVLLSFTTEESNFIVRLPPDVYTAQYHVMFEMQFKAKYNTDGILASGNLTTEDSQEIWELKLTANGIKFLIEGNNKFDVTIHKNIKTDRFYKVIVELRAKKVRVVLHDQEQSKDLPLQCNFNPEIKYGAGILSSSKSYIGFVGCIKNLKLNDKVVDLRDVLFTSEYSKHIEFNNCQITSPCKSKNICGRGSCALVNENIECDCSKTGYSGPFCQYSVYEKSCARYYQMGYRTSGLYHLDVDNTIVTVRCEFNHNGDVTTIIHHNIPDYYPISNNELDHFKMKISYRDYTPVMLKSLVGHSDYCSQEITYDCRDSRLYKTLLSSPWKSDVAALRDRCPCAAQNNCDEPDVSCNCDIMDGNYHRDYGIIKDKQLLPITEISLIQGQTTDTGVAKLTLGVLKCSVKITEEPISLITNTSSLSVPNWISGSLSFYFRTTASKGVILSTGDNRTLVNLHCAHMIEFNIGSNKVKVKSKYKINKDQWHLVKIMYEKDYYKITFNEQERLMVYETPKILFNDLHIGSTISNRITLEGCYKNFIINDELVDFKKYIKSYDLNNNIKMGCSPMCASGPCQRQSRCIEKWTDYECHCKNTISQSGKNCQHDLNDNAVSFFEGGGELINRNTTTVLDKYNPLINNITFNFKTSQTKKTLLFFVMDDVQNLLQFYLENETTISVFFNYHKVLKKMSISTTNQVLNNGESVQVVFQRNQNSTTFEVHLDSHPYKVDTPNSTLLIPHEEYEQYPYMNKTSLPPELVVYQHSMDRLLKPNLWAIFGQPMSYGMSSVLTPFIGCIRGLQINNHPVSLNSSEIWNRGDGVRTGCRVPCDNKQVCQNGGKCMDVFLEKKVVFNCNCANTSYSGDTCTEDQAYIFEGNDWILYDDSINMSSFTIEMSFSSSRSTNDKYQLLFLMFLHEKDKDYISVVIDHETGELIVETTQKSTLLRSVSSDKDVNNGHRKHVIIRYSSNLELLTMIVAGAQVEDSSNVDYSAVFGDRIVNIADHAYARAAYIYVGGSDIITSEQFNNYTGCLSNLQIHSEDGSINLNILEEYRNSQKIYDTKGLPKPGSCESFKAYVSEAYIPDEFKVKQSEWVLPKVHKENLDWSVPTVTGSSTITTDSGGDDHGTNLTWLWALLGCLIAMIFILTLLYVLRQRRRHKDCNKLPQIEHTGRSYVKNTPSSASTIRVSDLDETNRPLLQTPNIKTTDSTYQPYSQAAPSSSLQPPVNMKKNEVLLNQAPETEMNFIYPDQQKNALIKTEDIKYIDASETENDSDEVITGKTDESKPVTATPNVSNNNNDAINLRVKKLDEDGNVNTNNRQYVSSLTVNLKSNSNYNQLEKLPLGKRLSVLHNAPPRVPPKTFLIKSQSSPSDEAGQPSNTKLTSKLSNDNKVITAASDKHTDSSSIEDDKVVANHNNEDSNTETKLEKHSDDDEDFLEPTCKPVEIIFGDSSQYNDNKQENANTTNNADENCSPTPIVIDEIKKQDNVNDELLETSV